MVSTGNPIRSVNVTMDPHLSEQQVLKSVNASFTAHFASMNQKAGNLLFSDALPVNLLISSIKVQSAVSSPIKISLPYPVRSPESEVCLIVKDLVKGWNHGHEQTAEFYRALFQKKGLKCITEIIPLRQLRVEFKPYEARARLTKRFDVILVDRRVSKFIPRYFGKALYQTGNLPVIINVEAKSLKREVHNALNLTVMCVSRKGASTQVEVGNTSQRQSEIAANILAVSKSVAKRLPGGFLNVRGMSLRIGVQPWTVPVYVSYASKEVVQEVKPLAKRKPVIGGLSTLPPGWKVAVFSDGLVTKFEEGGSEILSD